MISTPCVAIRSGVGPRSLRCFPELVVGILGLSDRAPAPKDTLARTLPFWLCCGRSIALAAERGATGGEGICQRCSAWFWLIAPAL
jgi:hypothetical protein